MAVHGRIVHRQARVAQESSVIGRVQNGVQSVGNISAVLPSSGEVAACHERQGRQAGDSHVAAKVPTGPKRPSETLVGTQIGQATGNGLFRLWRDHIARGTTIWDLVPGF